MIRILAPALFAALGLTAAFADVELRRMDSLGKSLDSFKTVGGRTYQDVTITKINAGGLSLRHSEGTVRLRFEDLSTGQRKYFGIEEEAAKKIYQREAARRAAYEGLVEKREEERRVRVKEEAEERKEERRLEMAAIAAERAKAIAVTPVATIPPRPTIIRVDTRARRSRSYHGSSYGGFYGYSSYSSYRPHYRGGFRNGGFRCYSRPSVVIRR